MEQSLDSRWPRIAWPFLLVTAGLGMFAVRTSPMAIPLLLPRHGGAWRAAELAVGHAPMVLLPLIVLSVGASLASIQAAAWPGPGAPARALVPIGLAVLGWLLVTSSTLVTTDCSALDQHSGLLSISEVMTTAQPRTTFVLGAGAGALMTTLAFVVQVRSSRPRLWAPAGVVTLSWLVLAGQAMRAWLTPF